MKLLELLPELEEGGVERHVVSLSTALSERGHQVHIVSGGGKLERELPAAVTHWRMPVYRKNPVSILRCAWRVALMTRNEGFQLFHAHSRVPAWVAYIASCIVRVPFVVTAHFFSGNRSRWIYRPYRRAARVLCVSHSVEQAMADCFSGNTVVVRNGLPPPSVRWRGPRDDGSQCLLFIGRLTSVKGLQDVLRVLSSLKSAGGWRLDVLGDSPLRSELEDIAHKGGIDGRVFFHGFRDDTDTWLERCSCLLFPSYHEGMSLTLARAIQMKTPIIASDIPSVRELCSAHETLVPPGDLKGWRKALEHFLTGKRVPVGFDPRTVPSLEEMTTTTEDVYRQVVNEHHRRSHT
ncbi:MAG: glycosyltransferase [Desulfobulbaceae bacterium]|nr:glycosyltransferase [Desulfobulbaceae bacterium]